MLPPASFVSMNNGPAVPVGARKACLPSANDCGVGIISVDPTLHAIRGFCLSFQVGEIFFSLYAGMFNSARRDASWFLVCFIPFGGFFFSM